MAVKLKQLHKGTQHTFTSLGGRMGFKYVRQCEKSHLNRKMFKVSFDFFFSL